MLESDVVVGVGGESLSLRSRGRVKHVDATIV